VFFFFPAVAFGVHAKVNQTQTLVVTFCHADGRTDRQADRHDEANSTFAIFQTLLKISYLYFETF
jgi:hypothetical protein